LEPILSKPVGKEQHRLKAGRNSCRLFLQENFIPNDGAVFGAQATNSSIPILLSPFLYRAIGDLSCV
jgi:hypothetical protein